MSSLGTVELVGSLCAQPCSVRDSTGRPYPLPSPTTIPRPIALFVGQSHYSRVGCATIGLVALQLGRACCYWVGCAIIGPSWCAFPPYFCSVPLHTPPHHSLRRISLYLHTSLFSFHCCNPGHLFLAFSFTLSLSPVIMLLLVLSSSLFPSVLYIAL